MRTDQKLAEIIEKISHIMLSYQELIASTTALRQEVNQQIANFKKEIREEIKCQE